MLSDDRQDERQAVENLAREIQAYLDRHPTAADTTEGVLAWWIARQRMTESLERVQRALDYLVSQQRVCAHRQQGGAVLYTRIDNETRGLNKV